MNNRDLVKIAGDFEGEILRTLRGIPGVQVQERTPQTLDHGVDAILTFAGTNTKIAIETKQRADAATAWQLVHRAHEHPETPLVLIAQHTTAEARRILQDKGVGVLDGHGNAHLELPGLLFHLEGNSARPRLQPRKLPPTRLRGKAGVAAQALLLDRQRRWKVNDLADQAQISEAFAHRLLARLERDGLVRTQGIGPKRYRTVFDATALLDLWIEENADRAILRNGFVLTQSPRKTIEMLGEQLAKTDTAYAITGAAAASLVAPFVTAVPVTHVWVEETKDLDELLGDIGGEPVAQGHNVVLMQAKDDVALAFRERSGNIWIPNKLRLYADLMSDPRRGPEQATHLREELIGF